jgi:hypothetical protein
VNVGNENLHHQEPHQLIEEHHKLNEQGHPVGTYDCKEGRCASLQFSVGFATKGASGAGPMNDWNRKNRWVRAYADDVNDPWLAYDVDLSPGGTYENLDDQFGVWRDALGRFTKYINWKP